jgi:ADP-dependent NAD(P)H-hydrate dehydratase / NAD(P)H-hydrate epimerase
MIVVTAEESRRLDALTIERYGTPGSVLMERAGAGATAVLLAQFPHVRRRPVIVCAGKGNNGGDGLIIARLLRRKQVRAEVLLFGRATEMKGDAAAALKTAQRARVPITPILTATDLARVQPNVTAATLIVDAVFGTGLNAAVEGLHADLFHLLNASGVPIFAVDMPSGLHADRGTPLGVAVQAEATATFGFAKIGQVVYPGADYVGALAVVDIGIPAEALAEVQPRARLLEPDDVFRLLPVRAPEAHKGTCGHVLVIAGSRGHTGAALLAAHAACRTGAGLTTLAGPSSLNVVLSSGPPEVMTAPLADRDGLVQFEEQQIRATLEGKSAVVVGPGIGTHESAQQLVRFLVGEVRVPMVIDADALTCLAREPALLRGASGPVLLTPHPGEMARLLASDTVTVQSDRVATARRFAEEQRCVVVLKGARSVIAAARDTGGASLWINPTGNPGMASGGMGDALAGILGGLLAQGLSVADAACLGVYLHGAIADDLAEMRGPIGFLASDVIEGIPAGMARLRTFAPGPRLGSRRRPARRHG